MLIPANVTFIREVFSQVISVLWEDRPTKRSRHSVAEMTRPHRSFKEEARRENKKPQGQKRKHEPRDAKYHNWHTPFFWIQIVAAAKNPAVGWEMSSTKIVQILQKKDPETFAGMSRSTIEGWIDRSGNRPKWSDAALRMAENGNRQGHQNGGRRGALVS
jgi:hypothetical protein